MRSFTLYIFTVARLFSKQVQAICYNLPMLVLLVWIRDELKFSFATDRENQRRTVKDEQSSEEESGIAEGRKVSERRSSSPMR
ncbi:hypothetical protein BDR22DRAFT_864775 [Usnea florida]